MNLYNKHTNPETLYGYKDRFKIPSFAWEEAERTGEWTEAEPYIMKDPSSAFLYVMYVMERRWPEAEPYIMKDPYSAYMYARYVIEGRWKEAEPYIMKNPFSASNYKEFIRAL